MYDITKEITLEQLFIQHNCTEKEKELLSIYLIAIKLKPVIKTIKQFI